MTPNQRLAIELLLSGEYTQTEIAKQCNISRDKLYRWRTEDPEFGKEYDKRKTEQQELIQNKFTEKLNHVTDVLFELALDENTEVRTRFNSAKYIIDRVYGTPASQMNVNGTVNAGVANVDKKDILEVFDDVR